MTAGPPHERLRRARMARAESLQALSERTGLRIQQLRAVEEGRFTDLPAGIYARAAIRSYATAYGLDPNDIVTECELSLPQAPDPILAIGRMHGVRQTAEPAAKAPIDPRRPSWRPFAAAAIDALVVGGLLIAFSVCAALLTRASFRALTPSAAPLALVGAVLGVSYFIWFGGLGGTTLGALAVGAGRPLQTSEPLTLRAIADRALHAASEDLRAGQVLVRWAGQRFKPVDAVRSVRRRVPLPWQPRRRDPAPEPWSPEHQQAAAPPRLLPLRRG